MQNAPGNDALRDRMHAAEEQLRADLRAQVTKKADSMMLTLSAWRASPSKIFADVE